MDRKSGKDVSFQLICFGIGLLVIIIGLFCVGIPNQNTNAYKGLTPLSAAQTSVYNLPAPTSFVPLSEVQSHPVLKGIKIDPKDPFNLEFIIDTKNKENVDETEVNRLIEYFLAAVTIPEKDLWVNLSPFEGDRVTSEKLGFTNLGKDLLGKDYILKQLLSSVTYPESELGKKYWSKVYEEVRKTAGTTDIPIDTFNKVWIVPDNARIHENGNIAIITDAQLKVMHEEDYLAMIKNQDNKDNISGEINKINSKVIKEIILPEIERDVNYGKNFAKLRQMYNSYIMALWFKEKLRDSVFKYYIEQGKIEGIDLEDKNAKDEIFNLYVEAYKKGVYNYIKKEYDPAERKKISRRYYSGGNDFRQRPDIKETRDTELSKLIEPGDVHVNGRIEVQGEPTAAEDNWNTRIIPVEADIREKSKDGQTASSGALDLFAANAGQDKLSAEAGYLKKCQAEIAWSMTVLDGIVALGHVAPEEMRRRITAAVGAADSSVNPFLGVSLGAMETLTNLASDTLEDEVQNPDKSRIRERANDIERQVKAQSYSLPEIIDLIKSTPLDSDVSPTARELTEGVKAREDSFYKAVHMTSVIREIRTQLSAYLYHIAMQRCYVH